MSSASLAADRLRFNLIDVGRSGKSAIFTVSCDPLLNIEVQLGQRLVFSLAPQQEEAASITEDIDPTFDHGTGRSAPSSSSTGGAEGDTDPILLACTMNLDAAAAGGGQRDDNNNDGDGEDDDELIAEFYYRHDRIPADLGGGGGTSSTAAVGNDEEEDEDDAGWFYFGCIQRDIVGGQVLVGSPVPLSSLVAHSSRKKVTLVPSDIVAALGTQFGLGISCHFQESRNELTPS